MADFRETSEPQPFPQEESPELSAEPQRALKRRKTVANFPSGKRADATRIAPEKPRRPTPGTTDPAALEGRRCGKTDQTLPKRPSPAERDPTAATRNNWNLYVKFCAQLKKSGRGPPSVDEVVHHVASESTHLRDMCSKAMAKYWPETNGGIAQ